MGSSDWGVLYWSWEAAQNSGQPGGSQDGGETMSFQGALVMSGDSLGFHYWRERCATGISWAETRDATKYFMMSKCQ